MNERFHQLTALLGERPDSFVFRNFLRDFDEELTWEDLPSEDAKRFHFKKSSLTLWSYKSRFEHISIHFEWSLKQHVFGNNDGDFPNGIQCGDDQQEVERKLGQGPMNTERILGWGPRSLKVSYDLRPFKLSFIFDGTTGQMSLATIDWLERPLINDSDSGRRH